MKKRAFSFLLTILIMLPAAFTHAAGAGTAQFLSTAFVAAYDAVARVQARVPKDGAEYVLMTDRGKELAVARAKGTGTVEFTFPAERELGKHVILQLLRRGETEVLCETNLFLDEQQNDGIRRVECVDKKIALTFDAAIGEGKTVRIMELLEQYGGHATFFVVGRYAEAHPELCREMIARGHELASHSYEHLEMTKASESQAYRSLSAADQAIRAVNGNKSILYRPPSGISTFRDRAISRGLGSEVILWEIDSGDGFEKYSLYTILNRTKQNLHNGGIVLMHVAGQWTLQALEELLPYYTGLGYEIVTVSDLLLKEDSFIDSAGMQRPLLHADALLSDPYPALFKKTIETAKQCPTGHSFQNGVCQTCGYARPEAVKGNGFDSIQRLVLGGGLYRLRITETGTKRFCAWAEDAEKNRYIAASNGVKSYSGTVLLLGTSPFHMEMESSGAWNVQPELIPITDQKSFSGTGDTVTDLGFLPEGSYRFSCTDKGFFVVRMYTEKGEHALVSRTGPCEVILPLNGTEEGAFFAVTADGSWKIEPAE